MALDVKGAVDGGVRGEKFLCQARTLDRCILRSRMRLRTSTSPSPGVGVSVSTKLKVAVLDRSMRTTREQPLVVFHVAPPLTNGAIFISRASGRCGSAADVKKPFNN